MGKVGLSGQGAAGVSWLGRVNDCGPGDSRPERWARASLQAALNLGAGRGGRGGAGAVGFQQGEYHSPGRGDGGRGQGRVSTDAACRCPLEATALIWARSKEASTMQPIMAYSVKAGRHQVRSEKRKWANQAVDSCSYITWPVKSLPG